MKIRALSRVHRGRLHHGAARSDQPMKALSYAQSSEIAGYGSAGAYRRNRGKRPANQLEIGLCIEREEGLLIQFDTGLKEALEIT